MAGGFSLCEMPYEKRCNIVMEKHEDTLDWLTLAAQCLGNPPLPEHGSVWKASGRILSYPPCIYFNEVFFFFLIGILPDPDWATSQWLPAKFCGLGVSKDTLGYKPCSRLPCFADSDAPRIFVNAPQDLAATPYYFNFAPSGFSNAW